MGATTPPEAELIEAAISGNVGAFAQIVCEYRPRVLRTACGVVGSVAEAEDVAQEVFIKVWNSLSYYHAQGSFASWLYRITVNTAIDSLRRKGNDVTLDDLQPATREPPEDAVVRRDTCEEIRRAVEALPPGARAALVLREFEQLSYQEIATVLQVPIGTVMSRLNYARRILRQKLAGD